jgi:hypothetical protein
MVQPDRFLLLHRKWGSMPRIVETKLTSLGTNRATIYLQKAFFLDSAFPFKMGDALLVKIRGKRLIVEADTRRSKAAPLQAIAPAKKSAAKRQRK